MEIEFIEDTREKVKVEITEEGHEEIRELFQPAPPFDGRSVRQ